MQIVKQSDVVIHDGHGSSVVSEYYMADKRVDLCIVHIDGRVPEKGMIVNSDFSCVCYVLDGCGEVCGDKVSKGDAFNILNGEKYYFNGKFSIVMAGTPAFEPSQSEIVD